MQFKLCGMNLRMPPIINNSRFNRRDFLRMAALAGLTPWQAVLAQQHLPDEILVNDVHSALNPTWVSRSFHLRAWPSTFSCAVIDISTYILSINSHISSALYVRNYAH
jgi:hypothetical protein